MTTFFLPLVLNLPSLTVALPFFSFAVLVLPLTLIFTLPVGETPLAVTVTTSLALVFFTLIFFGVTFVFSFADTFGAIGSVKTAEVLVVAPVTVTLSGAFRLAPAGIGRATVVRPASSNTSSPTVLLTSTATGVPPWAA